MANITANMTVVSKEIQYQFESRCLTKKTFNSQYDKSYEYTGAAAGNTINIKQPHRVVVGDGREISTIPDDEERTIELPRATWKHVVLNFTSQELAQDLTKAENAEKFFGKARLDASLQSLSGVIDTVNFANVLPKVYNFTRGAETTNPSDYGDIGEVKAVLDKNHAMDMDRYFILTNDSMASINKGTSGLFNPTGKKSDDYDTGELADFNGFSFWASTYLPRHVNGSASAGAVNATLSDEGIKTIEIKDLGADTINPGDRYNIAGVFRRDLVTKEVTGDLQDFVVVTATAPVAGVSTVTFEPAIEVDATKPYANVDSFPQEDAVVTFAGKRGSSQSYNAAYQKDAFALGFVDLPSVNVNTEAFIRDPESGFSMKLSGQGDILKLKSIMRLDVLFGSTVVNPWWACIQYAA